MKGIDVSEGSGTVDFEALKSAGYDFVIARAGYGSDVSQIDRRFNEYVEGAINACMHVGAYWFIYARTLDEAKKNAECFAEIVRPWHGMLDMPVYIDYEYDSTRYFEQETGRKEIRAGATAMIKAAAEKMEDYGYYTGIYLNPDYIENHVYYSQLTDYTLWLANWGVSSPAISCGMWQKSGDVKIPQATGRVDLNECFTDFPFAIRKNGLNGYTKSDEKQTNEIERTGNNWTLVDDGNGMIIKLGGESQ